MITQTISIIDDFETSIELAAGYLAKGEIIGFPTDTVYGIGCLIDYEDSMKNIFRIKGRVKTKTLGLYLSDINNIDDYCYTGNSDFLKLADKYLPGPITIILKSKIKNKYFTAPDGTIAIRIPENDFLIKTIDKCGIPLTGTSANISGNKSISDPNNVIIEIGTRIPYLFSEGILKYKVESSIISLASDEPVLIREGAISKIELEQILGKRLKLSNMK